MNIGTKAVLYKSIFKIDLVLYHRNISFLALFFFQTKVLVEGVKRPIKHMLGSPF